VSVAGDFYHEGDFTMKKLLCVAVGFAAVGLLGANHLITQDEALVSAALKTLRFESLAGKPGVVGAPPKFKVTKKTIEHLEKLLKDGSVIEVQGNGAIKIIEPKK
jgi:hypothetical protein